ncbi:MAG TPA: PH domain-containing protein [Candidatus Poseidoniales archaeon]|nr:MAG TPA: PH domain-containing protein [Candidatus Poseidoniales archaeon]HII50414.1 PH domain-containing protein [Candidatus Poseidoniaceae archaeon]|tara:strand:+ start:8653 stop:9666 length:1014 start_codon:yes stop_codon:yes gene_type:complete
MTDEETTQDVKASEELESKNAENLANKFRLIAGEEIHMTKKPSIFAFVGMYGLGILVLGLHFMFGRADTLGEDSEGIMALIYAFIDLTTSDTMSFSFILVMLFVTWMNRLLNTSTSGKWVTIWLLLVSFTPLIIQIDDFIFFITDLFGEGKGDFIGIDYNFYLFGIAYTGLFFALTIYYQNSFHYAITSDAVIFEHSFLLSRSHRRILFDRISEVIVERTPVGTVFGYATVSILTDSGVGIVDETMGAAGAVNMPGTAENSDDTAAEKAKKSFLRSFVGILTYQRTIRTVRPDPKHCFYSVRNWDKCKMLLNEMHKKHSQSNLLSDLKDSISSNNDA